MALVFVGGFDLGVASSTEHATTVLIGPYPYTGSPGNGSGHAPPVLPGSTGDQP